MTLLVSNSLISADRSPVSAKLSMFHHSMM